MQGYHRLFKACQKQPYPFAENLFSLEHLKNLRAALVPLLVVFHSCICFPVVSAEYLKGHAAEVESFDVQGRQLGGRCTAEICRINLNGVWILQK